MEHPKVFHVENPITGVLQYEPGEVDEFEKVKREITLAVPATRAPEDKREGQNTAHPNTKAEV